MGRNLGLGGKIWAINVPNCARKKLVVSNRVRPIGRVGSGSALWVGVQAQTLPYASCRVDPDPIGCGLG